MNIDNWALLGCVESNTVWFVEISDSRLSELVISAEGLDFERGGLHFYFGSPVGTTITVGEGYFIESRHINDCRKIDITDHFLGFSHNFLPWNIEHAFPHFIIERVFSGVMFRGFVGEKTIDCYRLTTQIKCERDKGDLNFFVYSEKVSADRFVNGIFSGELSDLEGNTDFSDMVDSFGNYFCLDRYMKRIFSFIFGDGELHVVLLNGDRLTSKGKTLIFGELFNLRLKNGY